MKESLWPKGTGGAWDSEESLHLSNLVQCDLFDPLILSKKQIL